ncbi:MAG: pectinesterase, partial [Lachnospiraceae bacterium]|nr:pectinesterase [Lachnospiraceae bacterium]
GSNKAEEVFITDKEIGDDENLTGRKQEFSGSTQSTGKKGQGSTGSKASLDSVIGDYSDRAYARVDNDEVPASMKDVVKEYFSSFEE